MAHRRVARLVVAIGTCLAVGTVMMYPPTREYDVTTGMRANIREAKGPAFAPPEGRTSDHRWLYSEIGSFDYEWRVDCARTACQVVSIVAAGMLLWCALRFGRRVQVSVAIAMCALGALVVLSAFPMHIGSGGVADGDTTEYPVSYGRQPVFGGMGRTYEIALEPNVRQRVDLARQIHEWVAVVCVAAVGICVSRKECMEWLGLFHGGNGRSAIEIVRSDGLIVRIPQDCGPDAIEAVCNSVGVRPVQIQDRKPSCAEAGSEPKAE
jgi:hypothetical protein